MNARCVLVVEDDIALREALADTLETAGHSVVTAADGNAALEALGREDIGIVVSDMQMQPMDGHTLLRKVRAERPELPFVIITAYGTIEKAVTAMRDGASDYLVKPFEAQVLVELIERYRVPDIEQGGLVAADPVSLELAELARRVAASEATVLLSGESGTGKEVYARYIHEHSSRASGPFVAINCAAIPDNMLEAVLFGHDKGAFTGAVGAHAGKFEQAQGGTLLLDEISEMDLGLQAKLLRVLQEREVERVGGKTTIRLDVRVLATTNRSLRDEVEAGNFREDLFYRLNVFPLALPPLRERLGDIVPLAERLLERHATGRRANPVIADGARRRLEAHGWPGNVRELDNLLQRTLIMLTSDRIDTDDLRFEAPAPAPADTTSHPAAGSAAPLQTELRDREHQIILDALASAGSRKAAAEQLGISPRTLRYKLARLREAGIDIPRRASAQIA